MIIEMLTVKTRCGRREGYYFEWPT